MPKDYKAGETPARASQRKWKYGGMAEGQLYQKQQQNDPDIKSSVSWLQ